MKTPRILMVVLVAPCALSIAPCSVAVAAPEVVNVKLDNLRSELPAVAKRILEVVEGEKQTTIAVGHFSGPAQLDTNFGPGFEDLLSEALENLQKGVVRKKSELSVQGSYAVVADEINGTPIKDRVIVKVRLEILDKAAAPVKIIMAELRNNRDIAAVVGFTGALEPDPSKPEGTKAGRAESLKLGIEHPQSHIEGTKVKSTAGSDYAVELHVAPAASPQALRPRTPTVQAGQAMIVIQRGEIYEVVLYNNSDREAAVAVKIDGLDVFTFSEDRKPNTTERYTHYIIGAHDKATIHGWHLHGDDYARFLVTEHGKGARFKPGVKAEGGVGVIHAQFSFTSPKGKGRSAGVETGFGPLVTVKTEAVERDIDPAHDFVTIRYAR